MKFFFLSLLSGLFLFSFWGCQMPNDGVPFYLQVDSLVLITDPTTQGENSHGITDIWVEAGSENLGAYGLPVNFPVLQDGNVRFLISAGVKESGQSGIRVIYPFYQPDTFTINAQREGRYMRIPQFKYKQGAQFALIENFLVGNKFTTSNSANIDKPNAGPDGSPCLQISTNTDSAVTATQTAPAMDLPEGQEIWLEIDYRCDIPFYIGFFANYANGVVRTPVMFVTEKPEWNKVYVKFSNFVGASQADSYNLYFEALRPFGSSGGSVWIDNVKLVHF